MTDELRAIAEQAAEAAVAKTLMRLGIDVEDPEEYGEVRRDFVHLRTWRQTSDTIKKQGLVTAIGFIATALLGWLAITLFGR